MEYLIAIPDDVFKQDLLQYLTIYDIISLDTACTSHIYRKELMNKLAEVTLVGDIDHESSIELLEWLQKKKIYLQNLTIDQVISHTCRRTRNKRKIMMDISTLMKFCTGLTLRDENIQDDDIELLSSSAYFSHLKSVSIIGCRLITDKSIYLILTKCLQLQSFHIYHCDCIKSDTILSKCSDYPALTSLSLVNHCYCSLTPSSITALLQHCTGLTALNLTQNYHMNDSCIIPISCYCTQLKTLLIRDCRRVTDASITAVAQHCPWLQYVDLSGCDNLSGVSVMSLGQYCKRLTSLTLRKCRGMRFNSIFPAILKHCNGLLALDLTDCPIRSEDMLTIRSRCTHLQSFRFHSS